MSNKINRSLRRLSHLLHVILFYFSGPHMCNNCNSLLERLVRLPVTVSLCDFMFAVLVDVIDVLCMCLRVCLLAFLCRLAFYLSILSVLAALVGKITSYIIIL